ncbi:HAMP domain-containing protein [Paenibacillus thiaminolyticus]|nr:HAMP domain-containing protein [Paenibacillus thiaminolyticus]
MSVPIAPWSVYALIPYQTFSAQNGYLLQFTAVTVAIVIAVIAAVAAYVVKRVTKPIIRLARSIGAVQPERPFRPLPQTSSDEIGMLVHSYNQLSDNIRRLTEQVKENEARKKEADLLALQAQIHPHFCTTPCHRFNGWPTWKGTAALPVSSARLEISCASA